MRWLLLAAVCGLVGCGKNGDGDKGDDKRPEKAAVIGRVELEELAGTYRTNEAKADDRFTARRVTLEGTVKSVGKADNGAYFVRFEHGVTNAELPVIAYFPASESARLGKYEFRSSIHFTGRCDGWEPNSFPRFVAVRDCQLVEPPKTPAVKVEPKMSDAEAMKKAREEAEKKAGR